MRNKNYGFLEIFDRTKKNFNEKSNAELQQSGTSLGLGPNDSKTLTKAKGGLIFNSLKEYFYFLLNENS